MSDQDSLIAPDPRRCCFFLDLDGTLAELQPRPEQVFIPPDTLASLADLHGRGVPVAVVSGRQLEDLDRLLAPLRLPCAGVHGAERRDGEGRFSRVALDPAVLHEIETTLTRACSEHPGLRLENKGMAFALHYRQAPELADEVRVLAETFAQRHADVLSLQPGKCVYELKPRGASKGEVIRTFMQEPPFQGRMPVFLGDDLTDEAGFATVNQLGGLSYKIGTGETEALHRLASVTEVGQWLAGLVATLDGPPPFSHPTRMKGSP